MAGNAITAGVMGYLFEFFTVAGIAVQFFVFAIDLKY